MKNFILRKVQNQKLGFQTSEDLIEAYISDDLNSFDSQIFTQHHSEVEVDIFSPVDDTAFAIVDETE